MPGPVYLTYEQILQRMVNTVVARTSLTDLTDSSVFKHLLAGPARELDEVYFQMSQVTNIFSIDSAVGDDLDARAAEVQPTLIKRLAASKAIGTVVFGRPGTTGLVSIPIGTVVKTASGVKFVTTAAGSIANLSSTSSPVPVVAQVAGAAGNVDLDTVTKFESKPAGVTTVNNPSTFVGGADKESDDVFRARIKGFISTLARNTIEALEFIAKTVTIPDGKRVVFAHVFEDPIYRGEVLLYIDDGGGTAETVTVVTGEVVTQGLGGPPPNTAVGGEQFLRLDSWPVKTAAPFTLTSTMPGPTVVVLESGTDFLLDDSTGWIYFLPDSALYADGLRTGESLAASYTAHTGLIAAVQKIVEGDPDDRVNFPGWRAAGVRVRVVTPAVLQQLVSASVLVADGYSSVDVQTAVKAAISDYINNLGISGDVIVAELVQRIMEVPGVINVTILDPTGDVILLDDQLPRITSANITLS